MKTSMVISLKKILYRIGSFLMIGMFLFTAVRFQLPDKLFHAMAKGMIAEKNGLLAPKKTTFSFNFIDTVYAQMPTLSQEKTPQVKTEPKAPVPVTDSQAKEAPPSKDFSSQSSSDATKNHGIIVKNHAEKSFQTEELLNKPLPYDSTTGGYKVLVVHTHTTECYFPDDRSNDETKNMIQIGKEFTSVLEENGIKTLHITKVHDVPYTTSYKKSLESITAALAEHPTIEVVVDLHRDALYNENGEKVKPLATVNGESAAQVMIVTGTEKGGLPHPNWEDNLAFALKVQNDMQKNYPNLARPVDLRKERFNTHTTKNSIIFEIGANGNTLEEAIRGARLAAKSVANVLK